MEMTAQWTTLCRCLKVANTRWETSALLICDVTTKRLELARGCGASSQWLAPNVGSSIYRRPGRLMRVAILARVSTEEQAANDRHSLPMQLGQLREMALRQGWEVVKEFCIRGESAYGDDINSRPEFVAALDFAVGGGCQAILVYDFSRFSRSQVVAHTSLFRLRKAKVKLIGANGVDYTEEEDWAGMESVFARRASRDHGRRIRDAYSRKHAIGLPTGDIPFGYELVRPDLPPVVVEAEAEAIRWAFQEFAANGSYLDIAREFNRRGLSPRSKPRKLPSGYVRPALEQFTKTSLQRMLSNPFYRGYVSHAGELRVGQHAAIVDEALWASVVSKKAIGTRSPRAEGLLSGMVVCEHCHSGLWNQRSGSGHRYYREQRRGTVPECETAGMGMRADTLDDEIEKVFGAFDMGDGWWASVRSHARRVSAPAAGSEKRRAELLARRKRAGHALVSGSLSIEEHDGIVADVLAELEQLPPAVVAGEKVVAMGERLCSMAQVWRVADASQRRDLVREVLRGVRVDLEKRVAWVVPAGDYEPLFAARRRFAWYARVDSNGHSRPGLYLPSELVA